MIKAGSLFYAIVISIVIAIASSLFILSVYLSKQQTENFETSRKLHLNADSGYNLLLSKQTIVLNNQSKNVDLYNLRTDSVYLQLKIWGSYEVAISKSISGKQEAHRIGLIGYYQSEKNRYSLYLADEDKPLSVCGNTLIKGTSYLPKAGTKRAYIEGQSFSGIKLIDGDVKQSNATLPRFNQQLLQQLQSVFNKKQFYENDSSIAIENELSGDTIKNSFFSQTLFFSSPNSITIGNGNYSGNIVIYSSKQITVLSDVNLNDVILFAPKIKVEKGFKGNIQAYGLDSIIIEENVTLNYPSVLGIIKEGNTLSSSHIILNQNDTVSGAVFVYKIENNPLQQAGLLIQKNATVIGQVYTNDYIDLQGIIKGSLMCNKIMLQTASSVYENHLLSAVIDVSSLSKYYTGINLVEESAVKKTIKWLN